MAPGGALGSVQKCPVLRELRFQLVETVASGRDGLQDRGDPRAVLSELEHLEDLLHDSVRSVAVGLVHDEEVRDLHEPRLDGLNVVAHTRRQDDDARLGEAEDFHLVLAHADRLDENVVVPGGVEHVHGVGRRAREAPEMPARGHRPNEHSGIRVEVLHANPVAEDRSTRERRRRVHGDDADSSASRPGLPRERGRERRLARSR